MLYAPFKSTVKIEQQSLFFTLNSISRKPLPNTFVSANTQDTCQQTGAFPLISPLEIKTQCSQSPRISLESSQEMTLVVSLLKKTKTVCQIYKQVNSGRDEL